MCHRTGSLDNVRTRVVSKSKERIMPRHPFAHAS